MRYTRNRQLIKATGQTGWKEARVLTIEYMRKAIPDLDSTFKWHRGGTYMSWVEFKPNSKETKLIPAK